MLIGVTCSSDDTGGHFVNEASRAAAAAAESTTRDEDCALLLRHCDAVAKRKFAAAEHSEQHTRGAARECAHANEENERERESWARECLCLCAGRVRVDVTTASCVVYVLCVERMGTGKFVLALAFTRCRNCGTLDCRCAKRNAILFCRIVSQMIIGLLMNQTHENSNLYCFDMTFISSNLLMCVVLKIMN